MKRKSHVCKVINTDLLREMVAGHYVAVQQHPEAPIFIYNYTAKAQYDKVWNEVTLACRGLILDANHHIIARPFPKFFNLDELKAEEIPQGPFEVFEKLDGSLGILYWLGDEARIATRGSFAGEQAVFATSLLHRRYAQALPHLQHDRTCLFEIIYPANRIVVNYGNAEELVLLAVIDNATGEDLPLPDIGFPLVQRYDGITDIAALKALADNGREGFVIRFRSGLRAKLKFAEYVRLHRIITGVSSLAIWEYLAEGKPLDELLERVPDEFYKWVQETAAGFGAQYRQIEEEVRAVFEGFREKLSATTLLSEAEVLSNRKVIALYFRQQAYPAILFKMLDGHDYSQYIWKLLRPPGGAGFVRGE